MPSPLLHASLGLAVGLTDRAAWRRLRWRHLLLTTAAATIPDLDVLPGLLIGDPNRFHAAWSHSVGAALVAAGVAGLLVREARLRVMFGVFSAWTLSVSLDTLTPDQRPPYGVPLLWPLSSHTFHAPTPILAGVKHGNEGASVREFLADVFSSANLTTLMNETVIAGALILVGAGLGALLARLARPPIEPELTVPDRP